MSEFKGIEVVAAPVARSGEKYRTAQGHVAIKDGIKVQAEAAPAPRKPSWLRAPLPAGARPIPGGDFRAFLAAEGLPEYRETDAGGG